MDETTETTRQTQYAPPVTERSLMRDLRDRCGMSEGQVWIVHSSLKSIGEIDGGAAAVVRALQQVIGPDGTLLMPTFSDPQPDGVFDMRRTPSRTGWITETFRRSADVIRSRHPTHSVAGWGARAAEFTAGHMRISGLGEGSPFHRAANAGAQVLMIGCQLNRLSVIHVAEAMAKCAYLGKVWYAGYDRAMRLIDVDGREYAWEPRDPPGDSQAFWKVQRMLEERGLLHHCGLGGAECLRLSANDALAAAMELLHDDPGALLCDNPRCEVCPQARQWLER